MVLYTKVVWHHRLGAYNRTSRLAHGRLPGGAGVDGDAGVEDEVPLLHRHPGLEPEVAGVEDAGVDKGRPLLHRHPT